MNSRYLLPCVNSGVFWPLIQTFCSYKCISSIWITEAWTAALTDSSVFLWCEHSQPRMLKSVDFHKRNSLTSEFVSDSKILGGTNMKKKCTWCCLSWIELRQVARIDFYSSLLCGLPRGSLTAHIASPWNIDESFPVASLMQQLLWAMINRMLPFRLKCASVSTVKNILHDTDASRRGRGQITTTVEGKRGMPPCLLCSLGNRCAPAC